MIQVMLSGLSLGANSLKALLKKETLYARQAGTVLNRLNARQSENFTESFFQASWEY